MKASARLDDEIRKVEMRIQKLKRKYGSFRRLYRFVEYGEPLDANVDPVEAWDDMWTWKNLQIMLEELKEIHQLLIY